MLVDRWGIKRVCLKELVKVFSRYYFVYIILRAEPKGLLNTTLCIRGRDQPKG